MLVQGGFVCTNSVYLDQILDQILVVMPGLFQGIKGMNQLHPVILG